MKIVVMDAETVCDKDISLDFLKKFGDVIIYPLTKEDEIDERIKDADILLCNKTQIKRENMKNAKKLKFIGLFATGFNNIDIVSAKEMGITVCNVPSYSTNAVAQQTFAFILQIVNQVGEYNKTVLEGDWIKSRTFSYFPIPMLELNGKTLGIVGYGNIGKAVATIGRAFGMNISVYNRHKIFDDTVKQVSFDELLKTSDIVSLHCPLNDDSRNMMNSDAFSKMKKGAIFINTARGPLVCESALKDALESGHLLGAGVDVLNIEPMTQDCPLYKVKNCLITPHISWAGVETRKRLMKVVEDNIALFLEGKSQNVVNR